MTVRIVKSAIISAKADLAKVIPGDDTLDAESLQPCKLPLPVSGALASRINPFRELRKTVPRDGRLG